MEKSGRNIFLFAVMMSCGDAEEGTQCHCISSLQCNVNAEFGSRSDEQYCFDIKL